MNKGIAVALVVALGATACAGYQGGRSGYEPGYGNAGYGTGDGFSRNTVLGGVAGAAVGGAVGGAIGGREGALIGAISGAVLGGLAGRQLSRDPFSQYSYNFADQTRNYYDSTAHATQYTPVTLANGQSATRIDEMRVAIPRSRLEAGDRLSADGYGLIQRAVADARAAGGGLQVMYPQAAPSGVLNALQTAGASLYPGPQPEYVLLLQRGGAR